MSSLNQAFIKAYQRQGVAAPHVPLPPQAPASDVTGETSAPRRTSSGEVRAFDRQAAVVPPSHLFGKPPLPAPLPSRYAADDVPPLEPAPAAVPEEAKPAAAISREDNLTNPEIASKFDAELVPAYEAERFEWPSIVTSLADQADAELAELVKELLPDGRGALLVSGCRRGEGRTTIALLIARHLARSGLRTLAIDADFERPTVAARLATAAELGWEETLTGETPERAMIESLSDRLVILPLRKAMDDAQQAAAALNDLRGGLLRQFDVLCIDAGPLAEGGSDDAIDFGQTPVAAAIVVRDARHTRLEQSHAVGRKLVKAGVSRWAIIENFV